MVMDFFTFVRSYHTGDSVGVEQGYPMFCTVFKIHGHHRYLEKALATVGGVTNVPHIHEVGGVA